MNISAVSSGGGQIVFGDSSGYIHIADRQFNLSSFQAYGVAVTHLYQLKQRNVLVSVGVRALSTQRFVFVFVLPFCRTTRKASTRPSRSGTWTSRIRTRTRFALVS